MIKSELGVALTRCFICGEGKEIIMNTRLTKSLADKVRAMNGKAIDKEPCEKCKEYMKKGVIIIAVDESKTDDPENPYRTGGWWLVKEEALERVKEILDEEGVKLIDAIIKHRIGFVGDDVCRYVLGLYQFTEGE